MPFVPSGPEVWCSALGPTVPGGFSVAQMIRAFVRGAFEASLAAFHQHTLRYCMC